MFSGMFRRATPGGPGSKSATSSPARTAQQAPTVPAEQGADDLAAVHDIAEDCVDDSRRPAASMQSPVKSVRPATASSPQQPGMNPAGSPAATHSPLPASNRSASTSAASPKAHPAAPGGGKTNSNALAMFCLADELDAKSLAQAMASLRSAPSTTTSSSSGFGFGISLLDLATSSASAGPGNATTTGSTSSSSSGSSLDQSIWQDLLPLLDLDPDSSSTGVSLAAPPAPDDARWTLLAHSMQQVQQQASKLQQLLQPAAASASGTTPTPTPAEAAGTPAGSSQAGGSSSSEAAALLGIVQRQLAWQQQLIQANQLSAGAAKAPAPGASAAALPRAGKAGATPAGLGTTPLPQRPDPTARAHGPFYHGDTIAHPHRSSIAGAAAPPGSTSAECGKQTPAAAAAGASSHAAASLPLTPAQRLEMLRGMRAAAEDKVKLGQPMVHPSSSSSSRSSSSSNSKHTSGPNSSSGQLIMITLPSASASRAAASSSAGLLAFSPIELPMPTGTLLPGMSGPSGLGGSAATRPPAAGDGAPTAGQASLAAPASSTVAANKSTASPGSGAGAATLQHSSGATGSTQGVPGAKPKDKGPAPGALPPGAKRTSWGTIDCPAQAAPMTASRPKPTGAPSNSSSSSIDSSSGGGKANAPTPASNSTNSNRAATSDGSPAPAQKPQAAGPGSSSSGIAIPPCCQERQETITQLQAALKDAQDGAASLQRQLKQLQSKADADRARLEEAVEGHRRAAGRLEADCKAEAGKVASLANQLQDSKAQLSSAALKHKQATKALQQQLAEAEQALSEARAELEVWKEGRGTGKGASKARGKEAGGLTAAEAKEQAAARQREATAARHREEAAAGRIKGLERQLHNAQQEANRMQLRLQQQEAQLAAAAQEAAAAKAQAAATAERQPTAGAGEADASSEKEQEGHTQQQQAQQQQEQLQALQTRVGQLEAQLEARAVSHAQVRRAYQSLSQQLEEQAAEHAAALQRAAADQEAALAALRQEYQQQIEALEKRYDAPYDIHQPAPGGWPATPKAAAAGAAAAGAAIGTQTSFPALPLDMKEDSPLAPSWQPVLGVGQPLAPGPVVAPGGEGLASAAAGGPTATSYPSAGGEVAAAGRVGSGSLYGSEQAASNAPDQQPLQQQQGVAVASAAPQQYMYDQQYQQWAAAAAAAAASQPLAAAGAAAGGPRVAQRQLFTAGTPVAAPAAAAAAVFPSPALGVSTHRASSASLDAGQGTTGPAATTPTAAVAGAQPGVTAATPGGSDGMPHQALEAVLLASAALGPATPVQAVLAAAVSAATRVEGGALLQLEVLLAVLRGHRQKVRQQGGRHGLAAYMRQLGEALQGQGVVQFSGELLLPVVQDLVAARSGGGQHMAAGEALAGSGTAGHSGGGFSNNTATATTNGGSGNSNSNVSLVSAYLQLGSLPLELTAALLDSTSWDIQPQDLLTLATRAAQLRQQLPGGPGSVGGVTYQAV